MTDGQVGVLELMVEGKLAPSRSEARRLVMQGGVTVDDEKVDNVGAKIDGEKLRNGVIIRRGKKAFRKFILK